VDVFEEHTHHTIRRLEVSSRRRQTTTGRRDAARDGASRDQDDARTRERWVEREIAQVAGDHAAHGAGESSEESRGEKGAAAAGG